jgi:hypothetical protein
LKNVSSFLEHRPVLGGDKIGFLDMDFDLSGRRWWKEGRHRRYLITGWTNGDRADSESMMAAHGGHIVLGIREQNAQELHRGVKASREGRKIRCVRTLDSVCVQERGVSCGQNDINDVVDGVSLDSDFCHSLSEFFSQTNGFGGVEHQ